jgi:hypothetical protein
LLFWNSTIITTISIIMIVISEITSVLQQMNVSWNE